MRKDVWAYPKVGSRLVVPHVWIGRLGALFIGVRQ